MKYILRLAALPFFLGIWIIWFVYGFWRTVAYKAFYWMKYGGEATNYNEKANAKTIAEVFYKLQESQEPAITNL